MCPDTRELGTSGSSFAATRASPPLPRGAPDRCVGASVAAPDTVALLGEPHLRVPPPGRHPLPLPFSRRTPLRRARSAEFRARSVPPQLTLSPPEVLPMCPGKSVTHVPGCTRLEQRATDR